MHEANKTFVDLSVKDSSSPTALELVTKFLFGTFGDADSMEEASADIKRSAQKNPEYLKERLQALETVLSETAEDGTLSNLVAWEANWVLDDETDVGAKKWLREIAEKIRVALGDNAPSPFETTKSSNLE